MSPCVAVGAQTTGARLWKANSRLPSRWIREHLKGVNMAWLLEAIKKEQASYLMFVKTKQNKILWPIHLKLNSLFPSLQVE